MKNMISELRVTTIFELYTSFDDTRSVEFVYPVFIYPYARRELPQSIQVFATVPMWRFSSAN